MSKSVDKKKKREKEVKKKVLARRAAIRTKTKEEDAKEREQRDQLRFSNRLANKTIRIKTNDTAVVSQLHHNLEILKALQKEQEDLEKAQRDAPQMNTEGVPQVPNEEGGKLTASADVIFTPNPEPTEEKPKE